jgi:uroporphyrinogen decarboxylase
MPTATLTSRQRVNRMFDRADQDRIPRHDSYWGQTIENWVAQGGVTDGADALAKLGSDFHNITWLWPTAYNEDVIIEQDDQTVVKRDQHGRTARWWKHRQGTPEHLGFECTDRDIWQRQFKPMILGKDRSQRIEQALQSYRRGRERDQWTFVAGVEGFEQTRALIGDEGTAIGMVEDPEWVRDVSDTCVDALLAYFQAIIDRGAEPDGLWLYGDMAYKNATMCSPQMYREIIWPGHQRAAEFAREHGMKIIYHTDGCVNGVIDLYLEAGFDALQPLEAKAHMDVRDLCPRYGDRLAAIGNIDVMVMATNDLDLIEHEIESKLAAGMATRGYAYHSDHSVPPTVTWPTYRAIIDLIDRHGSYA